MIENVLVGQFVETSSVFHRLDPRSKLISIFCIVIAFFLIDNAAGYLLAGLFVFGCITLSHIPWRIFLKGLKPILFILSFTIVYHILFTKGENLLFHYGILSIYIEGIISGSRLVVRIILLVLITSLLTLTTKPLELAYGFEVLCKPLKKLRFPVEQFSLMLAITLRFIPTIVMELDKIIEAQKARGVNFEDKSLMKKVLSYIPIIVPLLFTSINRAENLANAIDARAYGDGSGRTRYKTLRFETRDYIAMSISLFMVGTFLILKMLGG
ncbi:energy-coupling factor transporter transmembrane protein EcfT [Viridibacillus sp. YIM B01967]|uniref:Energy-coupling factor transporter transmembrane protein EcfT n=1 Tax=Viridibacillus soli TaxID=2798301 RepID=A0ABS1H6Z2_9BACL|nr:energy-coupling factor transporter transmembrane component T [Viridibacillus soli]MBK3495191.1 energy-coupling factor transporter transmembrane protein EcfT [Viridibacillus soli]